MTTLEEFQGLRVYRVLKRIGEQPTREKEWDILKRIAERNQIQIRIAVLAQGERTRVLRIGTDREGRGLARSAVARRERLGAMAGVIGWWLVWTIEKKTAESPSQVDSKDSKARKLASSQARKLAKLRLARVGRHRFNWIRTSRHRKKPRNKSRLMKPLC